MPDCSLSFGEALALLKMATRAEFLCHRYAVLFVLKEIGGMLLGFRLANGVQLHFVVCSCNCFACIRYHLTGQNLISVFVGNTYLSMVM